MRFLRDRGCFGFVALAALFGAPAASIVYDVPTDAELVARSPLIVYGRVEYTAPAPDGDFTDATVRVERVLRGPAQRTMVVRQQGGRGVVVMGLPMLRQGDRALLFLQPGLGGVYRTVGMGLGIFFEDQGHLVRHDVPEDGFRHAERFGRWIEERAAGLARPVDYRVQEIPGPRPVRQDANWIVQEGTCGPGVSDDTPHYARWAQWDDGFSRLTNIYGGFAEPELSTKVWVTAGGWTNEQALTMTNAAAAMWNGDSGSRVEIPAAGVVNTDNWRDGTRVIQSFIGVEYGADLACSTGDVKQVRLTHEYNGAEKPLFWDKRTHDGAEVGVVMFDENGASTHAATNSYRCLKWNQTTQGTGKYTNAGDALCATHEGAYTPQGTVETLLVPSCDDSGVHAATTVKVACDADRQRDTLHSIPGGGGQARRMNAAWVRIPEGAMSALNADQMQALVAHELGHALGIDHPASGVNAVMNAANPVYTSLQPDDLIAVRKLYPAVTGGSSPPPGGDGGGGGAPPREPEPDPEPPPAPPPVPPVASFTVDVPCADGLCRARTGEDVTFTDTSSGTVARRSWDFETNGRTPSGRSVTHTWPSPGFYRSTLTVDGAGAESTASRMFRVDAAEPAGSCVPGPETACLQDSRFEVEVEWQGADGASNAARLVHAGTDDSGMFSFFDRANWEVLIKVLDGCAANGHVWVFGGSTTDLGYVIRVTDTATGAVKEYRNEPGSAAAAITDATAFPGGCRR
ncbi:MAG: PKD domain-containing protein [Acidobacteria bacterium]|nr:PKD domain-containing protein [Acidobacteriota bacterium]